MFRRGKYRLARWFFRRPILPFVVEFVVLAPLVLVDDPSDIASGYVFLLPWIVLLFGIVNLPLIGAAFRAFKLEPATRRNHALEHATIHYLEAKGVRRLSGRATRNGFRIFGRASVGEIRTAFGEVRRVVRDRGPLPYISRRCGSNVVTALGLSLLLLSAVALGGVVLQPPLAVRASALAVVILFFFVMRHGIGNWIQRRFFMMVDFDDISLRDIREVQPGPMEGRPVHFVETIVRAQTHNAVSQAAAADEPRSTAACEDTESPRRSRLSARTLARQRSL